jgi:choline dehydrogenase-like flavoprotein
MTDWIVVGAGSAGCVVARRLAETPGHHVTLIEAGPAAPPDRMRGASFFDSLAEPGRVFPGPYLRGRGLGGTSVVNGMLATAGDVRQYHEWGWHDAAEALDRVLVPRQVARDDEIGPLDRALLAAAPEAVLAPLTRRDGRRVTAADAYLNAPPAGLRVVTDAAVNRIVLTGERAVGVEVGDGATYRCDAVVVAAGAVGSPALLARSGVEVGGLGEGLRDHPAVPISVHLASDVGVANHGLVTGTLLRRGDIELVPLNHLGPGHDGVAMVLVVLMTPGGRGIVRSGGVDAVVDLELSTVDRHELAAGVDFATDLLTAPGFRRLVTGVSVGEPPAGVYHATSTCAMGTVVDESGAVSGYRGLYVIDASVFPDIPATHPYLPTLILAERLAARLLTAWR